MLTYILSAGVAAVLLYALIPDDPPKCGYYRLKGKFYYLKYAFFYLILKLRAARKLNSSSGGGTAGYGVKSRASEADMENCQQLPDENKHPMAVDAVYFSSSNSDGYYLVTATSRRQNGMIQILTYLRIPDVGLFELPLHPDTLHPETEPMSFSSHGLTISLESPMRRWRIRYNGQLRHVDSKKLYAVKLNVEWKADGPYYDFDTDTNIWATCDSIARMPWSRAFFNELKFRHQTHYEQFGETHGQVSIEGLGDYQIDMYGLRDHSYGNIREWRDLFRYHLQYIHLEDGTYIAVGNICMPKILSRYTMGYVIPPDRSLHSISYTDFEFWRCGDDGQHPSEFSFKFSAGGKLYDLTCSVVDFAQFHMRDRRGDGSWSLSESDRDDASHGAVLYERFCRFRVNGVSGTGISEWCYENIPRHHRE